MVTAYSEKPSQLTAHDYKTAHQIETEKREKWLSQLKVGDQFIVDFSRFARNPQVGEIVRLTNTQFVVTSGDSSGSQYKVRRMDGYVIGFDRFIRIHPMTEDATNEIRRHQLIQFLNHMDYKTYPLNQLQQIHDLVTSFPKPPPEDQDD